MTFDSKPTSHAAPAPKSSAVNQLVATKNIEHLIADAAAVNFARTLTALDLMMMGIGGVIGSGIFVLPGAAAANHAGPAVMFSFILAGCVAGIAGICYAELSSIVPVAGSSYTYTYTTLGELAAWYVAWNIVLECLVSASVVGAGWSAYFMNVVAKAFGSNADAINPMFIKAPIEFNHGSLEFTDGIINIPAVVVVLLVTGLLMFGTKKSTIFNTVIVFIKIIVIVVVVVCLFTKVNSDNLTPFIPPNTTGVYGKFGITGVLKATSIVFFAYLGFDMVSCTAQECKNPQRDLPIGIIGSLIICTLFYVLVCIAMTGSVPYEKLGEGDHAISLVVELVGFGWLAVIVDIGAVVGLLSVMITMLTGAPRVLFIMARDGLMPEAFTKVHPRYQTPYFSTIICGVISALCAGLFPIELLAEISSVGTLYAFASTCIGVSVLRVRRPDLPRPFKVPGGPYLFPVLGAVCSMLLIVSGGVTSILRFLAWMSLGTLVYFAYGYRRSAMNPRNKDVESAERVKARHDRDIKSNH